MYIPTLLPNAYIANKTDIHLSLPYIVPPRMCFYMEMKKPIQVRKCMMLVTGLNHLPLLQFLYIIIIYSTCSCVYSLIPRFQVVSPQTLVASHIIPHSHWLQSSLTPHTILHIFDTVIIVSPCTQSCIVTHFTEDT